MKVYHYFCTRKLNTKKHKNMGKISVKHYFNSRLKSENIKGEKYNPLYVQIIRNTKTHQIKSVFVTEKITDKELQSPKIQELCNAEKDLILSFFEFADKVTGDFVVSKSKTNLGALLDFYANYRIALLLEWVKADFIPPQTRFELSERLAKYIAEKTGFSHITAIQLITANVGLHAKEINGKAEFVGLGTGTIKELHNTQILTDKEAGMFEFVYLLHTYNFDNYILPFEKYGQKNKMPLEFLNIRVWQREKDKILQYISEKGQPYTREYLSEYVEKAEKVFADLFKQLYFVGKIKNE